MSPAGGSEPERGVGLARRLGVIVYDSLLLFAVLYLATAPMLLLTGGESPVEPLPRAAYQLYLCLTSYLYFGWFWTHGGQTLGMKAWRCRLVTNDGGAVGWAGAARRFLLALLSWGALGLGFLSSLLHPRRLAWHDVGSGTYLRAEPQARGGSRQPAQQPDAEDEEH